MSPAISSTRCRSGILYPSRFNHLSKLLLIAALVNASAVFAQRADNNAVTAAEDAFGSTIGNESIGLYSARGVRGFSPVDAGNIRIEGLYIDRQGALPPALVQGSTIRVGLSAQSYPFPAPTGIVDYRLNKVEDTRLISLVSAYGPYGGLALDMEAKLPIVPQRFGIATGISYAREEYYDGSNADYLRAAIVPRWRPTDHTEIIPFWSISQGHGEETPPVIVTAGSFAPPEVARRHYFGQRWAANETLSLNYGVIGKSRLGDHLALSAGAFYSSYTKPVSFTNLFRDTRADGLTHELIIADPEQRYASSSGEIRVSRSLIEGPRLHVLHLSWRSRQLDSRYGGSAAPLDLGWRQLGTAQPIARPAPFTFGTRTHDTVTQQSLGLTYESRWREVGEWSLGMQRTRYEKRIEQPGLAPVSTHTSPLLLSATASAHLSDRWALYAGYTRGLEESGVAPSNVDNRNEALPAIRTEQRDAGLRWAITPKLKLVAGLFDVRKPYFSTSDNNLYTTLGEVQHRGSELSLIGNPLPSVSMVLGAVLMQPRVTGEAVDAGRISRHPVGQHRQLLRADLEYRPVAWPAWSFDTAAVYTSSRTASRDGLNILPSYTTVDLGARYRFTLGHARATLRLQLANVADTYAFNIYGSNSYGLTNKRRFTVQLAVDLPE